LTLAGIPVVSTEGATLSNAPVATFTTTGGVTEPASDFLATIEWGDGSSTQGTVGLTGSVYTISGSHQFTEEGSFAVSVIVVDETQTTQGTTTAAVAEAPLASVAGTSGL